MKKVFIIIVVILIIGAGAYWFTRQKPVAKVAVLPPVVNNGKPGMHVEDDPSLFGWMSRGKSAQCDLTGSQGNLTVYTKNNKIRIEGVPYAFNSAAPASSGVSLTDGEWVYMWSGDQGTKLNMTTLQATMSAEQKAKATDYSWQDSAKKWETEYKYNCRETTLSDDLFTPPSSVKFNDMTVTFKDLQQVGQDLQNKAQGGTVNQEDISAQLEKLKNSVQPGIVPKSE